MTSDNKNMVHTERQASPSAEPAFGSALRLRKWRAYGRTVEITHTRDLRPIAPEEARVRRAVNAYIAALEEPEPQVPSPEAQDGGEG